MGKAIERSPKELYEAISEWIISKSKTKAVVGGTAVNRNETYPSEFVTAGCIARLLDVINNLDEGRAQKELAITAATLISASGRA